MIIDIKHFLILQGSLLLAGVLSYHLLTNILGRIYKDTPAHYLSRVYDTERVFRLSRWLFLLVWGCNIFFSNEISAAEGVSNKPYIYVGLCFTIAAGVLAKYASSCSDRVLRHYQLHHLNHDPSA